MKISENKMNENMEKQAVPKLRNIHEKKETPEEKPEGADVRLKICAAGILILIVIISIRGFFTKSSFESQVEEKQKQLTEVKAEALLYGITEDENGELVIPEIDINQTSNSASDQKSKSIEERNTKLLDSFTGLLLNWKGHEGYHKVRQTLINDWAFTENSKLLKSFMPKLDDELDANMSLSGYSTFVLSDTDDKMSYFLICTVRNTINGTSASGTVGIQITINKDGTISNVIAQTLS